MVCVCSAARCYPKGITKNETSAQTSSNSKRIRKEEKKNVKYTAEIAVEKETRTVGELRDYDDEREMCIKKQVHFICCKSKNKI